MVLAVSDPLSLFLPQEALLTNTASFPLSGILLKLMEFS